MNRRPESERSDWTDLDLLTRDEAAERLREEIAEIEPRLAELPADDAERALLEARLGALRAVHDDLAVPDGTSEP
ncbi:hypothetical protein IQ251_02445 [Saccharopolyspora sp. HNM0983]|uniref:Uncharacterized protein n=1 Tax=Saccharopolyspora montiporae TaxID=2781240 RepID=A0A929FZ21_9PSEU|nr:hypothetical protein [Saccharopolyspora sp. HNM0983]MBE9373297.1 hypothetical protein [Saccharopolyspora sp. HNM0983]